MRAAGEAPKQIGKTGIFKSLAEAFAREETLEKSGNPHTTIRTSESAYRDEFQVISGDGPAIPTSSFFTYENARAAKRRLEQIEKVIYHVEQQKFLESPVIIYTVLEAFDDRCTFVGERNIAGPFPTDVIGNMQAEDCIESQKMRSGEAWTFRIVTTGYGYEIIREPKTTDSPAHP